MAQLGIDDVVAALRTVREDLGDETVTAESLVVNDLGIDSLDLVLLARVLRREHQVELDSENWPWQTAQLGSILDHIQRQ